MLILCGRNIGIILHVFNIQNDKETNNKVI